MKLGGVFSTYVVEKFHVALINRLIGVSRKAKLDVRVLLLLVQNGLNLGMRHQIEKVIFV
jgi:hypothetical protein